MRASVSKLNAVVFSLVQSVNRRILALHVDELALAGARSRSPNKTS